ncbi:MAG: ABC transporter permease [Dehalococcoidia bacterium]|nr:ABC transporter permease [Dehalococcoidia bacterium]
MEFTRSRIRLRIYDLLNFWKVFRASKLGIIGVGMLAFFIVIAIFCPVFSPYDPREVVGEVLAPPSPAYILGTDQIGRDILSRVLYGTRMSLLIGITAAAIAVFIGTTIGLVAGYFGKFHGEALMRVTDMFLVMPQLPLMIVLAALLGRSLFIIMMVIGVTSWPWMARIIRSEVLSLKKRPFVERAICIGCSDLYLIRKHILPNVMPLITANAILTVPGAIVSESTLSFIGLGDPTAISWGSILSAAFNNNAIIFGLWYWFIPPGLAIVFLSVSFALIGHVTDEVLNPRLRKQRA